MNGHERHGTITKSHRLGHNKVLWSEKVCVNVHTCVKVVKECKVNCITFKDKMYQRPNNALRGHQQLGTQVLVQQLNTTKPSKVPTSQRSAYKANINQEHG